MIRSRDMKMFSCERPTCQVIERSIVFQTYVKRNKGYNIQWVCAQ